MKKYIYLITNIITIAYSLWYASLGGFVGNKGALSKIGLSHHYLFALWGILTCISLFWGIIIGFSKTKYRFYKYLLILSAFGMLLTLCFDFDYSIRLDYILHCTGSLLFSAVTGVTVFLLFLLTKRKVLTVISGIILLSDLILLLIYKETAIIELFPIISGCIMLCINTFKNEEIKLEINK